MSGISRRIDQLGRVVIPVEVRKKLKLEEGSLLEISVENEQLILSKSEPLQDFKKYIIDVCQSVEGCIFFVTSESKIVFASKQIKEYEGEKLSEEFFEKMKSNKQERSNFQINSNKEIKDKFGYFYPLENYGDNRGYACFFFAEQAKSEDKGMMSFVAHYISSKL